MPTHTIQIFSIHIRWFNGLLFKNGFRIRSWADRASPFAPYLPVLPNHARFAIVGGFGSGFRNYEVTANSCAVSGGSAILAISTRFCNTVFFYS